MEFLRVIKDSEDIEEKSERKNLRGVLSEYKDETLQVRENEAWSKAMVEKYEVIFR